MPFHLPKDPCTKSVVNAAAAALRPFAAKGLRSVVLGALTLVPLTIFLVPAAVAAAPTVSLTKPLAGAVVKGSVIVDASASSNSTRVEYLLDGAQIAYDSSCCSWDESWDTTRTAEGSHSLRARSRNSAGEWGYSQTVTVTVDNIGDPAPQPPSTGTPQPPSTGTALDRLNCTGYLEPRSFVESQAWWMPTRAGQTGDDFGHVHAGLCIPERETHSKSIPLDIRVILHDNPGKLLYVSIVVKGQSYETTVQKLYDSSFVGAEGQTVSRWFHYDLDPASFAKSGLQEIRVRVFIDEPNTSDQAHTSINWQTHIANGKSREDVTRRPYLRLKGWYTGAGYCESAYRSDLTPLPDAHVSGIWSPSLRMAWDGDSSDRRVTRSAVRLDPDFHAEPAKEGTVLRDASGEFTGVQPINTATLTPGAHKLHMKADCDDPRATNSGVGVVTFRVGG